MEDFLKEVRYSVVSLIEKFLTTASQQLDNFLETSWLLHTMTDVFYETLQKKDTDRCMSTVLQIVASWFKWL